MVIRRRLSTNVCRNVISSRLARWPAYFCTFYIKDFLSRGPSRTLVFDTPLEVSALSWTSLALLCSKLNSNSTTVILAVQKEEEALRQTGYYRARLARSVGWARRRRCGLL